MITGWGLHSLNFPLVSREETWDFLSFVWIWDKRGRQGGRLERGQKSNIKNGFRLYLQTSSFPLFPISRSCVVELDSIQDPSASWLTFYFVYIYYSIFFIDFSIILLLIYIIIYKEVTCRQHYSLVLLFIQLEMSNFCFV